MDPTRQHYLKSEEAAELLGISVWTLRHWICEAERAIRYGVAGWSAAIEPGVP
jgi:hypothetical protein